MLLFLVVDKITEYFVITGLVLKEMKVVKRVFIAEPGGCIQAG